MKTFRIQLQELYLIVMENPAIKKQVAFCDNGCYYSWRV